MSTPKRIKLTKSLPVESKHGMNKNRVLDVLRVEKGRGFKVFCMGDAGEEIGVFSYEYEVLEWE